MGDPQNPLWENGVWGFAWTRLGIRKDLQEKPGPSNLCDLGWIMQASWTSVYPLSDGMDVSLSALIPHCETVQFSSVQFSSSVVSDSLWPHESQHAQPPCPSPTPRVHSDSRPSSQWCHPAISSLSSPSSCPQSLPASESFPMSQLFAWGGQSIGVSVSVSVLPMNIQDWFLLGWTGWISSQSKGLSKSFLQHHSSKASILRHSAFFIVQLAYPYLTIGKIIALTRWTFVGKVILCFLICCLGWS